MLIASDAKLLPRAIGKDIKLLNDRYYRSISQHNLGKGDRPWELVDLTAGLDQTQPWVGLEWENGFESGDAYRAAIDYMWASHHYWAVDGEGVGTWYGEFTFPPTELSKWLNKDSMFDSLLNFMHSTGNRMPGGPAVSDECQNCGSTAGLDDDGDCLTCGDGDPYDRNDVRSGWGMHINISSPISRDQQVGRILTNAGRVAINNALQAFTYEQNKTLFGRSPYGLGYQRCDPDRTQWWYEFKVFQTTDDIAAIDGYRSVTARLVSAIMQVEQETKNLINTKGGISVEREYGSDIYMRHKTVAVTAQNLFDFLSCKTDVLATSRVTSSGVYVSQRDVGLAPGVSHSGKQFVDRIKEIFS